MEAKISKNTKLCKIAAEKVLKRFFSNNELELPIPICEIAKFNGIEVIELETIHKEQSGMLHIDNDSGRKLIGINSSHHNYRKRFSIGHELGHYFLQHPSEKTCDFNEIKLYNSEADEFSAQILIPYHQLKIHVEEAKTLEDLNVIFDVSKEAMYYKLNSDKLLNKLFNK